jgi:hypothetical protein
MESQFFNYDDYELTLYLTQKDIDALYCIAMNIGGTPKTMRNVFSDNPNGNDLFKILSDYVTKDILNNRYDYYKGSIIFKE